MAKALFFNVPFHGHINPTLPLVKELVKVGDEVDYFSSEDFRERIETVGATFRAYDSRHSFERTRKLTHMAHLGGMVAEATNKLLPQAYGVVEQEQPDYIVFDMSAPWGYLAAKKYGIRTVASFPHLPFYWRGVLDDIRCLKAAMRSIRPGFGHTRKFQRGVLKLAKKYELWRWSDINLLSSKAELNIVFSSRYFQPHEKHFDESYVYIGPQIDLRRKEKSLGFNKRENRWLVYVAVGTVYRAETSLFKECFKAFSGSDYQVIMSVGKGLDTANWRVPDNFTVAGYVPQIEVLKQVDVFITHGGLNSINEAVHFGVPMVVVPNTVEQAINAARIEQLKAGVYLERERVGVELLQGKVIEVMNNPEINKGLGKLEQSFTKSGGVGKAVMAIHGLLNGD